jgi:hypothetical protein
MQRYKGTFNWYGEVHILHTDAPHSDAAYSIMTRVLAKKLQRKPVTVRFYFNYGGKDNFTILEEKPL